MITPETSILATLNTGSLWTLTAIADFVSLPDRVVEKALENLIRRGEIEALVHEGRMRYRRVMPMRIEE